MLTVGRLNLKPSDITFSWQFINSIDHTSLVDGRPEPGNGTWIVNNSTYLIFKDD